jgi:hypothetical protein
MSGHDDDLRLDLDSGHDEVDLDLDPYSPRQKHGLWGNAGWVIAVVGLAGALFSLLFVFDDDSVGKTIGIIVCVISVAAFAYGVSYMIRHRKPHYHR